MKSTPLWLVLDIGNTHTVAGLYDALAPGASPLKARALRRVRFRTDAGATVDEYRMSLTALFLETPDFWKRLARVIVSTVVPPLDEVIRHACAPAPVLSISARTSRDFELDLPFPHQLGADRLANVAGARVITGGPLLVVDAGTATTFCLVDSRPAYIGGAIVPGLEISWKALQSRAAKLFSVELIRPATSVGRDTESQLQSGVILGYEALIEGMADRLLADAGAGARFEKPTLFATGGCIQWLKLSPRWRMEPDLTLLGLLAYAQRDGGESSGRRA